MTRYWIQISAFLVAAAIVTIDAPARADSAAPTAKELYENARKNYNLGHYEEALKEFEKAYQLKDDPAFLFNIAQCQRNTHHYEDAERSYRAYLRESPSLSPTTREQVQKLIAEMERALEEQRSKQPPTGTEPPAATTAPNTTASPPAVEAQTRSEIVRQGNASRDTKPPLYKRPLFWGIVAGSVALVGIGVGLGVGLGTSPHYPSPTMGTLEKQ